MKNKRKKFVGIAKVRNEIGAAFVKYRFNDIDNFVKWCNSRYLVSYINIYNNREPNRGMQIASWTSKQGMLWR